MAAPHVDPPSADGSSLPPDPQASVSEPLEGDRSADSLVITLAEASRQFDGTGADPERNCWMAVHQHVHGVLPSEYDIREIDEELYLAVLAYRRGQNLG
jgi:hypothetical protein